jgi:uncharacterized protein (TIGR00369 family)
VADEKDNAAMVEEVRRFMETVPFNRFLGLELETLSRGFARMIVRFQEAFIGDPIRRAYHGGVISAIIDTCGGACIWTLCEPGDRLSTVDLRVDYLRPGSPEDIVVEAKVLRLGNRVGVAEMVAYHDGRKHEPVATGTAVYNVRRSPEKPASE